MGSMTINFADVDSFEPLPEGDYDVEVDKVEVRRNKANDGDYLNWELIVLDGEYENRRLWMISSLKPNALFRLKDTFLALEVIEEDEELELEWDDDVEVSNSGGPLLIYPELEGLEAVAVVTNEMYENRERNRVNELLGDAPKPKKKKRSKSSDNEQVSKARKRSRRDEEDDEDDYDDEPPKRSRRSRNDEEDDAPRSRRRRSRSDEDDEPPKRSRRSSRDDEDDEDDEEEERPRRRQSSTKNRSRRKRIR